MSEQPASADEASRKTVVIGVGNCARADDGVGPMVAERLSDRVPDGVFVRVCDGDATRLIEAWENADRVILVDAVQTGSAVGTIHRFEGRDERIRSQLQAHSTHGLGVAEAISLAQALGRLPQEFTVLGIESKRFGVQQDPSPEVVAAIDGAVDRVLEELG
jgi:hydrogenase maturation protease